MRAEENILLTRTGAGTPMGELFRRYWLPTLLASELPENDCPPVRVKLLGERLLAFRDSEGKLGLIDEFCAHRGVSLWFGRNEQCGLRCPYHGWKFDVSGQCVEVPSEPAESGYAKKIKLKSYPLVESGGVLWAYMGPPRRTAAPARLRMAESLCRTLLLLKASAGEQLAAGYGRRHRFRACVLAAFDGHASRSVAPLHQGRKLPERQASRFRDRGIRGRALHRSAPEGGAGSVLLAHHAIHHAHVHDGAALWRQRAERPCLGADRR